jgi:DNA-binding beta-propeller fold protein YncE
MIRERGEVKLSRLILALWFVLSLCPLAAVPGCGDGSQTPLDFGNASIELPQHVGYALAYIHKSMVVIDLEKSEAVGIHRICTDEEYVEDFAVGPSGALFVSVSQKGLSASNIVRVLDPGTGEVMTEITVSRGSRGIYALRSGFAVVSHPYLPSGSTEYACDVLDMNSLTLVDTFYFDSVAVEVVYDPEGRCFIGIADVMEKYGGYTLVELNQYTGEILGAPITLHTDFMFETALFATASKLYAPMEPSESPPTSSTVRPLGVLEFPSGRLVSTITMPFDVLHMVRVGHKVYVASFLGSTWKGALEVGKGVVSVVDANTDEVIKTIDVSPGPQHMAYSESTGKLYVACVDGKISVIDPNTDEVTDTVVCDDPRASGWGFNRIKVAS